MQPAEESEDSCKYTNQQRSRNLNAVLKESGQPDTTRVRYYEDRRSLASALYERGAILTSDPKDRSKSPIRFNLRADTHPSNEGVLSEGDVATAAVCMALHAYMNGFGYHLVAGVPHSGTAFARSLAHITTLHQIELEKSDDAVKDLDKIPDKCEHVLVINNMVAKGAEEIGTIHRLRKKHFVVNHLIALVDLEQGGAEALFEHGVKLHAVFTISELLEIFVQSGTMQPYMRTKALQYLLYNS